MKPYTFFFEKQNTPFLTGLAIAVKLNNDITLMQAERELQIEYFHCLEQARQLFYSILYNL